MPMPQTRLAVAGLASGAAAAALWARVAYDQWPALIYGASLCSGGGPVLGHCPLCYPAAALSGLALACAWGAMTPAPRKAMARIKSPHA